MKRIKLEVAYDGTNYCGWQIQPNDITVQGVLNKHLSELLGEEIQVMGASRTDSGVHALGNVAVFDTESRIPGEKMAKALNARLPEDIVIQSSKEVAPDFHPRFQETRKTYEYTFYNATYDNPVTSRHHHFVYVPLNVDKMNEAAKYFEGKHCFISMCSIKAQTTTYVRTIYHCEVFQHGRYIIMRVTGSGFLYNMVRLMAGTLLEIGRGKKEVDWVKEILASKERVAVGPKLPAKGLTLIRIEYPEANDHDK
ncbi:tRNA pseudouridine(38-40) synthase TruA [Anaerostipes sp.]|uniref:tRNA pseudouridine(38-40) synthase TruA n=1 Tax=Anaerostipes sp. TaxID=1872530 RepID=UPI003FF0354F